MAYTRANMRIREYRGMSYFGRHPKLAVDCYCQNYMQTNNFLQGTACGGLLDDLHRTLESANIGCNKTKN